MNRKMDPDLDSDGRETQDTLNSSFFETLWPLILDENQCRVESESVEFFEPRQPFDYLHWHTLLAKVGFAGYEKPHELHCCQAAKRQEEAEAKAEKELNEDVQRRTAQVAEYQASGSRAIRRIDIEVERLREEQERRQRLAYRFANRTYPWSMKPPLSEVDFILTPEIRAMFKCPMELEIIEGIYNYDCKLMLIDASNDVCADDFQRWIKFRPYVRMLCLVRCQRVQRQLQLLNAFDTLLIEEDANKTWHEELESSLRLGLWEARRLELTRHCADTFVFVFSRYRGLCTCDTFKILRRI